MSGHTIRTDVEVSVKGEMPAVRGRALRFDNGELCLVRSDFGQVATIVNAEGFDALVAFLTGCQAEMQRVAPLLANRRVIPEPVRAPVHREGGGA